MLDDLPQSRTEVARALGITSRTLARYASQEQAPRAVMIAIFWATRWGASEVNCNAINFGQRMAAHANALQRELEQMQKLLLRLESQRFESANAPFFDHGNNSQQMETMGVFPAGTRLYGCATKPLRYASGLSPFG